MESDWYDEMERAEQEYDAREYEMAQEYKRGYEQGRTDQKEEDNAFFNFEGAWELEKKKVIADFKKSEEYCQAINEAFNNGVDVGKRELMKDALIIKARIDAIEECKQILLDAMARDGKTKCHEYMVAINEMEKLKL